MSQYLLIERVQVQNANAVSGFTWGFPAITHFLGFSHNLQRKISSSEQFSNLSLRGCAVIAHDQQVHTYRESFNTRFTQYKSSQDLELKFSKGVLQTPPVVEEAKMNMTISLVIKFDGYLGNRQEVFEDFIKNNAFLQRMAGGTILSIKSVKLYNLENTKDIKELSFRLLPGFILQDRSMYLEKHYQKLKESNPEAQLLDAWFDFIALKQGARPKSDLLDKFFAQFDILLPNETSLNEIWLSHKQEPYSPLTIPQELIDFFKNPDKKIKSQIIKQWEEYLNPQETTDADWEYIVKPESGYLVPIMLGYKAITKLYPADHEISGVRDKETDLCFVESVHSIGEWQSVHRIKTREDLESGIWDYMPYEEHWYLCKQGVVLQEEGDYESEHDDDAYY